MCRRAGLPMAILLMVLATPLSWATRPNLDLIGAPELHCIENVTACSVTVTVRPGGSERYGQYHVRVFAPPSWSAAMIDSSSSVVQLAEGEAANIAFTLGTADGRDYVDGEFVVVLVAVQGPALDVSSSRRLVFVVQNGALHESDERTFFESEVDSVDSEGNYSLRFQGGIIPIAREKYPPEVIARLEQLDAEVESANAAEGGLAITSGALSLGPLEEGASERSAGCNGGGVSALGACLMAAMLLLARRVSAQIAVIAIALSIVGVGSARAVTRCIYGTLAFWDARSMNASPYMTASNTGWRLQPCDDNEPTCAISDPDCCYSALPFLDLTLERDVGGGYFLQVDNTPSEETGFFYLCDSGWTSGNNYQIRAKFRRDSGFPGHFLISATTTGTGETTTFGVGQMTTSPSTNKGQVSINASGDTTGTIGNYASIWTYQYESMALLEDLGETRHRKIFGSANSYDMVRWYYTATSGVSGADCSNSRVNVLLGGNQPRGPAMPHEFGHIYNGRVTGCDGGVPAFPNHFGSFINAHDWAGSEGVTMVEAMGETMVWHHAFDPDTAALADILADHLGCISDSFDNTNRASIEQNVANALWDFVDTDTSSQTPGYTDEHDLDYVDLMNAVRTLQTTTGSAGANHTVNEPIMDVLAATICTTSDDCANGQVCNTNSDCVSGDPHGANIRDIIEYVSGNVSEKISTLRSSPCIGLSDNAFPFTGGYRSD